MGHLASQVAGSLVALGLFAALGGCVTQPTPAEIMRLTPESAALRAVQTRDFSGISQRQLLLAVISVLQDQGYRITSSEGQLGLVTATKSRAINDIFADIWQKSLLAGVTMGLHPDVQQGPAFEFSVVVSTQPAPGDENRLVMRASFWRGQLAPLERRKWRWVEPIRTPVVYQAFFTQLDQSLLQARGEP